MPTLDFESHLLPILAGLMALLIVLAVARQGLWRTIVTVATWVGLLGLAAMVIDERGRFDPAIRRVTAMLGLERQQVSGGTVRIRMATDGHFWAQVRLNGIERRMLVDSGATVTALSADTAAAAGIAATTPGVPMVVRTANGTIRPLTGTLDRLELGAIAAEALPVMISPAFGDMDVLGMNFLSQLKSWRVEGTTLVLEPQPPTRTSPAA